MSITPSTTKSHPTRAKIALVSVLSLGLLGGSVAFAAPAQAETKYGCSVYPQTPRDLRGNKVDFQIKVDCYGKKTVDIRQYRFEDERGKRRDDRIGYSRYPDVKFDKYDGWRTIARQDYRLWSVDKVYQAVSFRVKDDKGNWSRWTRWENSGVLDLRH